MDQVLGFIQIIFSFVVILSIIVFVHEMGHYLVARWNDVAIEAFSLGFGPELWGFTDRLGTRWKLSAIPLGGYVRFLGDMNAASVGDEKELEKYDIETRKRLFYFKNVWQRIAIVLAGPVANIVFTFVLLYGLLLGLGRYSFEAKIDDVMHDSPAQIAGFLKDDKIVRVDGYLVRSFRDFQRLVATSPDRDIRVEVLRNGATLFIDLHTGIRMRKDDLGNEMRVGYAGVVRETAREDVIFMRPHPIEALSITFDEMILIVDRSFKFLADFFIGKGDVEQLGGPVKIAKVSGQAVELGFFAALNLIALLSLNIGIFNLFPIPLLDGGHLIFYFWEALVGKPLPPKVQSVGFSVGLILIMSLLIFTLVNDIF